MKSKEVRRLKFSGDAEFGLLLSHTDEGKDIFRLSMFCGEEHLN